MRTLLKILGLGFLGLLGVVLAHTTLLGPLVRFHLGGLRSRAGLAIDFREARYNPFTGTITLDDPRFEPVPGARWRVRGRARTLTLAPSPGQRFLPAGRHLSRFDLDAFEGEIRQDTSGKPPSLRVGSLLVTRARFQLTLPELEAVLPVGIDSLEARDFDTDQALRHGLTRMRLARDSTQLFNKLFTTAAAEGYSRVGEAFLSLRHLEELPGPDGSGGSTPGRYTRDLSRSRRSHLRLHEMPLDQLRPFLSGPLAAVRSGWISLDLQVDRPRSPEVPLEIRAQVFLTRKRGWEDGDAPVSSQESLGRLIQIFSVGVLTPFVQGLFEVLPEGVRLQFSWEQPPGEASLASFWQHLASGAGVQLEGLGRGTPAERELLRHITAGPPPTEEPRAPGGTP